MKNTKNNLIFIFISLFIFFSAEAVKANCSDGIDNDGDGLIDWQFDLGCHGPEDNNENAQTLEEENGWTTYDKAPDARVYYVSNSEGNDLWSGLAPVWNGLDGPKKTAAAGKLLVRNNSSDWLLFKRGDVWRDESLGTWNNYNGTSFELPIIIGSYGDSIERPKFEYSNGWFSANTNVSNFTLLGLHAYSYTKDPNNSYFSGQGSSAISILAAGGNLLFEDCKIEFGQVNIQEYEGPSVDKFVLRRNILAHSYSLNSHAQSLYTHVSAPLILEENLFYHGGWNNDFRLAIVAPNGDYNSWKNVRDGVLQMYIYNQEIIVDSLDFASVTNMDGVAQIIENGINAKLSGGVVDFNWTLGGVFMMRSNDFVSNANYEVRVYSGGGTDIGRENYLNATNGVSLINQGAPDSTIFNRNRYLSGGKGRTVLRRNIDADGASGGVQIREGGIVENELFLQNPISISIGHAQNSAFNVSGSVINNVILGNRNIDMQVMGTGIWIESCLAYDSYGPSFIEDLDVSGNIIGQATLSTGNIKGIFVTGNGPMINLDVHHNIIYDWTRRNWPNPSDHRACGVGLYPNALSINSNFRDNIIQQPESGFAGCSNIASVGIMNMSNNKYFSVEPDPPTIWSKGPFEIGGSVSSASWISQMEEQDISLDEVGFLNPNRNIEAYMASLGEIPTYEKFIEKAMSQNKYNWDLRYTASVVNDWIREGFTPIDIYSPDSPQRLTIY